MRVRKLIGWNLTSKPAFAPPSVMIKLGANTLRLVKMHRLDKLKKLLHRATSHEFRKLPWKWSWAGGAPQLEADEPMSPILATFICDACQKRPGLDDGSCLSPQRHEQEFIVGVINASPEMLDLLSIVKRLCDSRVCGHNERKALDELREAWEKFNV